jgi:RNA polymerase sigma-70 factor, ECF subfamily
MAASSPRMASPMKDFFVSYCGADSSWAEWIAWQLESGGYTTVIQNWDFGAGSNFAIEMDRALCGSRRLIAVLSPDYLNSRFAAAEWGASFAQDPTGTDKRLVPIRVRDCNVNGLLKSVVYIDLVGKTEAEAKAELLRRIRVERGKPAAQPHFPGVQQPKYPGSVIAPSIESAEYKVVITGTINEDQKDTLEAIVAHLRKLTGDASLTLLQVRKGSTVLVLRGTSAGFEHLRTLQKDGTLTHLLGYEVKDVELLEVAEEASLAGRNTLNAETDTEARKGSSPSDLVDSGWSNRPEINTPSSPYTLVDWAALVSHVQAGDDAAIGQLYKLFSRGIRYYLCRRLSPQGLEEKVQDTFLMVVNTIRRGDLRQPERIMGFIRALVRRQAAAYIETGTGIYNREQSDLETGITVADRKENPEQEAMRRQKAELMESALADLAQRDREILVRFYLKEQSQEQICREMFLTETQFRLLKSRAKAKFGEIGRKKLTGSGILSVFVRTRSG